MRFAFKFAYDGRLFNGFARQPGQYTVEGELLDFLCEQQLFNDPKSGRYRSASRTDKGVSALGNVIAFDTVSTEEQLLKIVFDSFPSKDIIIYGTKQVSSDFYPRYAVLRSYRYYLEKNDINLDTLLVGASLFTGEHNFSNFARVEVGKNPVRCIKNILIHEMDDFYVLDFYAPTFLWHQVRRMVSALIKINKGKISTNQVQQALTHFTKKIDYGLAPAEPLILQDVRYDFDFTINLTQRRLISKMEKKIISALS